jgi:hypothetical protein
MDIDGIDPNLETNKNNAWKKPLQKSKKLTKTAQSCETESATAMPPNVSGNSNSVFAVELNDKCSMTPSNTTISSLTFASREQAHLKRIADLEARLTAAENKTNSCKEFFSEASVPTNAQESIERNSSDSCTPSDSETIDSRLTDLETAIYDIKNMLALSLDQSKISTPSVHTHSTADLSYSTVSNSDCFILAGKKGRADRTSTELLPLSIAEKSIVRKHPKPASSSSLSILTKELHRRQSHPSTADYSQLTILTPSVTKTLLSPPSTPSGKKQRTQKSPEPIITAIMSQYEKNDNSSEVVR